jgi:hypothetical protein
MLEQLEGIKMSPIIQGAYATLCQVTMVTAINTCNVVLITKQVHSAMAFLTFFQQTFRDNL